MWKSDLIHILQITEGCRGPVPCKQQNIILLTIYCIVFTVFDKLRLETATHFALCAVRSHTVLYVPYVQ